MTNLITIPVFQHLVFTHSPEIMGVFLESNLHYALVMCEYRLMTVAEIKAPDFDIFVRRAGHN